MKNTLYIILFLFAEASFAKIYPLNPLCPPENLQLSVVNSTKDSQMFWIQNRTSGAIYEDPIEVAPKESLVLDMDKFTLVESQNVFIKSSTDRLSFSAKCLGASYKPTTVTNPWGYLPLPSPWIQTIRVALTNLSHGENTVRLGDQEVYMKDYLEVQTVDVKIPFGTQKINWKAQGRVSVYGAIYTPNLVWLTGKNYAGPTLDVEKTGAYFLMANENKTDSFVIHLTDPTQIQQARDLIKTKTYKLFTGQISRGHGNFNRSFTAPEVGPWSWYVSEPGRFADFGHIDCDGSPQLVEDYLEGWLASRRICFWSFHLLKELSYDQVKKGY